jgi:ADP-heptose:LPS heptosyltransferase
MAKMGDMVCTTPVFRAMKNKYPNARVIVMGNAVNKELLAGNPDVSEYIVYDKNNFWRILRQIRNLRLDVGILTGPSPEFLAMLYLSGAPLVIAPFIEGGFCPHETRVYKILRRLVETRPHRMENYAPREYLRLLEPLGVFAEDTKKHLNFSLAAAERARAFMQENDLEGGLVVGIFPGTSHKIKLWPSERFARLADEIHKKYGARIVIIGGPDDRKEVEAMKAAMSKAPFVDANGMSIDELKALISKLNLFVSVDTGPIYIAEAFGVPTVCVVGPMDEREQPPRGPKHKIAVAERQKPELYIMNNAVFNYKEARRQAEDITVEMVMEKIVELL